MAALAIMKEDEQTTEYSRKNIFGKGLLTWCMVLLSQLPYKLTQQNHAYSLIQYREIGERVCDVPENE